MEADMAKLTDPSGRPFSGIVQYPVPAIVVDNDDPDGLGRLQVKFPTLHDEPISFWLRQVSPNAGKEHGLYALPEVGDEVLVMFLMGSQDIGVVIGQLWNGEDKPPKEADGGMPGSSALWTGSDSSAGFSDGNGSNEKNDRRLWRSRSGHLFVFDDSSGSETVQIWDKSHKLALVFDTSSSTIILSADGDLHLRASKNVHIESGQDLTLTVGGNYTTDVTKDSKWTTGMNHTFEAKMDAKHKAGTDYKIEATMNFEAKASMGAKVEGSMTFEGKGGVQAKVSGAAMCEISGGIIKLN
jgi:uncharacterized protein involved in type VI secretion and phage assembly